MMASTKLEIEPNANLIEPTLSFIDKFAEKAGITDPKRAELCSASALAIKMVLRNHAQHGSEKPIGIEVKEREGNLSVEVLNRSLPLFPSSLDATAEGRQFHEVSRLLDRFSIENLGRQGQTFVLGLRLGDEAYRRSMGDVKESVVSASTQADLVFRELQPGEESKLSQLFFSVYGYRYISEFVYYPEKIKQLLQERKLFSMVAQSDGRLVGHVGLMKWGDRPPVYEPCLGVVDSNVKSRGVFGRLFEQIMRIVGELPMQYCFFDFVTNHDLSQRLVHKYDVKDLAIFVGCQSNETQARLEKLGLGEDPVDMYRYTLLYSILPRVSRPFGEELLLPNNLAEPLDFVLKSLGLTWSPTPRFEKVPSEGAFETHFQTAQKAVLFDLHSPGRAATDRILAQWQECLRNGYQYAAVEVPLSASGVGHVFDMLAAHGFFIAGFVPYHRSDQLGFRFQAIGPTKVAWDKMKIFSEQGKRLLSLVQTHYERTR